MKNLFCALLLTATSLGQVSYNAYKGSEPLQAGKALFTASDPAGTCKMPPAPYKNMDCRATGPETMTQKPGWEGWTIPSDAQGNAFNFNATLVLLKTFGDMTYTFGMHSGSSPLKLTTGPFQACVGGTVFNHSQSIEYCQKGPIVYSITYPLTTSLKCGKSNCYDPAAGVWLQLVDFRTACPNLPPSDTLWSGMFTIGKDNEDLSVALNFQKGGQNTGHLFVRWKLQNSAHECITIDTKPVGGTGPMWYSSKGTSGPVKDTFSGQPIQATWTIHESRTIGDIGFSNGPCTGVDCVSGSQPWVFQWPVKDGDPVTAYNMNKYGKTDGHSGDSPNTHYNHTGVAIYSRPLNNPGVVKSLCSGDFKDEDAHLGGDVESDVDALLWVRGGIATTTWTSPYRNELLACEQSGVVDRFTPTWAGGKCDPRFNGMYSQCAYSQRNQQTGQRDIAACTFDMMCGLRSDGSPDVFFVDLTGKLKPTAPSLFTRVLRALHIKK